jgi:hypothetical protein
MNSPSGNGNDEMGFLRPRFRYYTSGRSEADASAVSHDLYAKAYLRGRERRELDVSAPELVDHFGPGSPP